MKKQIALFSIVAGALFALPAITRAEDASVPAVTAPATNAPATSRFRGYVEAVDATAKTFTLGSKKGGKAVITITADTKITKDGKPATLADLVTDEAVYGATMKDDTGKLIATEIDIKAAMKRQAK